MMFRAAITAALLLPLAAIAGAPPAAPAMGTDIMGDRDAAVGLYLLPWKEEAPSDIDRPPRELEISAQPLVVNDFKRHSADEEANAAYRRVRVEPH